MDASPVLRRRRTPLALLAAAAILSLASCAESSTGPKPGALEVRVGDSFFNPKTRTVPVGSTVTWIWNSGVTQQHNVTFDDGPASPDQASGTYTRTFTAAGSYPYQCTLHIGMTGTVVAN